MFLCCRILAVALLLGIVSNSHSAQPRITKSSLTKLLQQPTVSAIHRDRKGILWIGTQQGLHRFDGANVTLFDADRSNQNWIPASEIRDITEDSRGNLLVATSGGFLLRMNPHTGMFDAIEITSPENKTTLIQVLVSKRGSIWLLSKDGLILFDARFESSEDWTMNLHLQNEIGRLYDIVEDEAGYLWVVGGLGLAKVLPQEKAFVSFDLEALGLPKNSRLTSLEISRERNLFVGTDSGQIVVWDIEASKPLANRTIAGSTASYISELVMYGETLIVATDRGLFASDSSLSYTEHWGDKGDGLSNPDIYSLHRDGKYVWIGTINGLDLLSFAPFELFNSKNSGISNSIQSFEEDSDDRIWVATYSGLFEFDDFTQLHVRFDSIKNSNSDYLRDQGIATMAMKNGKLWLGFFQNGVSVVDLVDGHVDTPKLGNANAFAITKILADNDADSVWIATYDHGLFRITPDETISYIRNQALPEKSITLLFQSKTSLLAVSENRVYQYNTTNDQFVPLFFDFGSGEKRPLIYAISQTHNDDILIGTKDHGLFAWSRENQKDNQLKLQSFAKSGLVTSTIYSIETDLNRNLWCSTQNGIVKLDSKGQFIKRFTTADGLQGNDFALGASFTSRKGLIYFGGVNGYNRFDPNEVSIDTAPSPMRLTAINLPQKDERNLGTIDQLKSLLLTHQDHFVTFQFSVLDFISPEKNQFRFKLENFDTDWVENATKNTATYTNLPAGDYVFRVQGANSTGIWNRDGITLAVHVLPPPWFSWWAYSIYGIVLLLLGWSAHRIYHSYAIDRKSAQMAMQMFEDANRADDEMQEQLEVHDELIQSAFQHHLTTLSLVSDFISHRGSKEPDDHLREVTESGVKRIAALSILESCLYYQAGDSVTDLHKYTENVVPVLLKSTSVASETIVTINEVTSILLPTEIATPLSIVIYELLENCMQHAFEPTSPANYIHIKMFFNPNSASTRGDLVLSIQDSGTGLPDSIENLALESSGIGIVQCIVKKLGGTVQCSDNKGTTISIILSDTDALYSSGDQSNPS